MTVNGITWDPIAWLCALVDVTGTKHLKVISQGVDSVVIMNTDTRDTYRFTTSEIDLTKPGSPSR